MPEGATGAVKFLGMSGWSILAAGLVVCMLAMVFGMVIYRQLKNMPCLLYTSDAADEELV